MVRTQVSLSRRQHEWLKRKAREEDVSMSEMVRQALDLMMRGRDVPRDALLDLVGAFVADREDVSVRHDEYLYGRRAVRRRR